MEDVHITNGISMEYGGLNMEYDRMRVEYQGKCSEHTYKLISSSLSYPAPPPILLWAAERPHSIYLPLGCRTPTMCPDWWKHHRSLTEASRKRGHVALILVMSENAGNKS